MTTEPTQAPDKRPAARRVVEEKAGLLRCSSLPDRCGYVSTLGFEHLFPGHGAGVPVIVRLGSTFITLFPLKGEQAAPADSRLWQTAFRAATHADFRLAQAELEARGVSFQFQDHEISHSIYFSDPDGFLLEITTYGVPKEE